MKFSQGFKSKLDKSQIIFSSRMINDINQRLCGGWWFDDLYKSKEEQLLIRRVIGKLKPFASIVAWKDKIKELHEYAVKNKTSDIVISSVKKHIEFSGGDCNYEFIICQKGTLGELFDLEALKKDYIRFRLCWVKEDIDQKKNNTLESYFSDWDFGDRDSKIEAWETGLILGYPALETLKRCYEVKGIKRKKKGSVI